MFIRKLNYVGLLTTLYSLATGSYLRAPLSMYEQLPFNTKFLHDIVLRRGTLKSSALAPAVTVDVGINLDEVADGDTGKAKLTGTVVEIGDLHAYGAFEEFSLNGKRLPAEMIKIDRRLSIEELDAIVKNL
jgi:hypothetical protein